VSRDLLPESPAVAQQAAEQTPRPAAWSPPSIAFACLCLGLSALALPVLSVRVPPLLDYPNHFARIWLLSGGIDRPPLSAMYALDWTGA